MEALLIIDPQNDFCDPAGSLFVPGAQEDMNRLAAWARAKGAALQRLVLTLDSHRAWDISHPLFWRDRQGALPAPFSQIVRDDVLTGRVRPVHKHLMEPVLTYLAQLEEGGRYQHTVWPEHCLIGSWGHNVAAPIFELCRDFEERRLKPVQYHLKGLNPLTEHYSAVRAEVPQRGDDHTSVNQSLLDSLLDPAFETVYVAGEALSHCVAATVEDCLAHAPGLAKKMVLIRNASSAVPGFEALAENHCRSFAEKGIRFLEI
ncbi:hypothetical protein [Acanthopleuribacter pedis]|uniref:Nicotinamidase n=1 Tax=Acanthopleuribacter pedis TaxID=442870 RepID=A0A8J7U5R4_9BACT|nr:hypothetical protein [Acanthopleuribacter pedis]MBO1322833.1 hypothetical protein [Acanthopleuribacter pedis]